MSLYASIVRDGELKCVKRESYLNKVNRHKGVNGINGTGKMVNTSKKGTYIHTYIHTYVNVHNIYT